MTDNGLTPTNVGALERQVEQLPPGRHVRLPGRGRTFIREIDGPPGAPTVMLLHGLAATADLNWFPSYDTLAERYRVVALDHRGHGRGIKSRKPFRLVDCADDVAALARVLDLDRFVVVGYSMGGPIAQLLYHRHPELISGIVLAATARNFRGSRQERLVYSIFPAGSLAMRFIHPRVGRILARLLTPANASILLRDWVRREIALSSPRQLVEAVNELARFSSHDWVGNFGVPTSVVVTLRDEIVPTPRQLKLAEAIPGATMHPINANHFSCTFAPERFTPGLLAALESVVSRIPDGSAPRIHSDGAAS